MSPDDPQDFSLAERDIRIPCPQCGNELVHDANSLTLAESPRGAMFECGACGEISQWELTLDPFEPKQVPLSWGGNV